MDSRKEIYVSNERNSRSGNGTERKKTSGRSEAERRRIQERKRKRKRKIMLMKAGVISLMVLFVLIVVLLVTWMVKNLTGNAESAAQMEELAEEAKFVALDNVTDKQAEITSYSTYGVSFNLEGKMTLPEGETLDCLELCLVDAYDDPKLSTSDEDADDKDTDKKDKDADNDGGSGDDADSGTGDDISDDGANESLLLKFEEDETGGISFYTSETANEGICLENMKEGLYCYLLKADYESGQSEYYTLKDSSGMEAIDYYTITKDGKNNEVKIEFKTDEEKTLPYLSVETAECELPEDVYDIVIDAGHGGTDTGAVSDNNLTEAELTLSYAKALEKLLEADGYKVLLTRDGTESPDEKMAYTMYDEDGRVNKACASKAKVCFCLHFNSNEEVTSGGVEVYCSTKADPSFATLIADNMVEIADSYYSTQQTNRVASGVYQRAYTEAEIVSSDDDAAKYGYTPYDLDTTTDYLFMIRELGGISTNAYIDGRNTYYGTNLYRDKNYGVESYLIESGYMSVKDDLKNLVTNEDAYVESIAESFGTWLSSL